jgi:hypothetical protein
MPYLPAVTVHCYLGHGWHQLCHVKACECGCHRTARA